MVACQVVARLTNMLKEENTTPVIDRQLNHDTFHDWLCNKHKDGNDD